MVSGTFNIFENAKIEVDGEQIGFVRLQKPNHNFGDTSRPDVGAGLGNPSVLANHILLIPLIAQDLLHLIHILLLQEFKR